MSTESNANESTANEAPASDSKSSEAPASDSKQDLTGRRAVVRMAFSAILENEGLARSFFAGSADVAKSMEDKLKDVPGNTAVDHVFLSFVGGLIEENKWLAEQVKKVLDGKYNEVSDIDAISMAYLIEAFNVFASEKSRPGFLIRVVGLGRND